MSAMEKAQGALKKRKASTNLDIFTSLEDSLETPDEKKIRMRSLYVAHFSLLIMSLGSSIILTGVYPYLVQLDPYVTMIEYGVVVACDAAAQMIFAPLFGMLVDRTKTVRLIALFCCLTFSGGNVMYALVGLFDRSSGSRIRVYMLMLARFIVGIGTGLNSAVRYYVSSATLISERTTHTSFLSLFQTIGFILGPGIQAALTPIGPGEGAIGSNLEVDMYTATGWVSAGTGILCLLLYMPGLFRECYISEREVEAMKKIVKEDTNSGTAKQLVRRISQIHLPQPTDYNAEVELDKTVNPETRPRKLLREFSKLSVVEASGFNIMDKKFEEVKDQVLAEEPISNPGKGAFPIGPIFACLYNYFSFLCNFVLLETICVKLAMDMWGWTESEAIANMGWTMMGAGGCTLVVFCLIGPLSKRFDERLLLFLLGIIPMILGRLVMFPIPGQPLPYYNAGAEGITGVDEDAPLGGFDSKCKYEWCKYIPAVHIAQFMTGFVIATVGYPFCVTLTGSMYSKLLISSNNPGLWLGVFVTTGSLARVIGPIVVTEIYELWGTYVLFITVTATLVVSLILTLIFWRQLVTPTTTQAKPDAGDNQMGRDQEHQFKEEDESNGKDLWPKQFSNENL